MRWPRLARDRATSGRRGDADLRVVPRDLRLQLPLLWPEGPDGPVDERELRALARRYARSGRSVRDLLADLDGLCDVVGIATPSAVIEHSTVAWSDAFVEERYAGGVDPAGSDDEVARRIAAHCSTAWPGLPEARLVFISLAAAGVPGRDDALRTVAALVHTHLPDAAVARQPARDRVVACVDAAPDLSHRLEALRSACTEHLPEAPRIEVESVPADGAAAVSLLRTAG